MSGKSEERKISEGQTAEQGRQFDLNLKSQLAQLRGRQLGQEEALQRAQQAQSAGESIFQQMTSGTPEAITRLQGLIRERALPEQQQALSRTKLAQQQAGVRGPEAALMAQQQATKMGTDLARAAEEVALKQALEDRSRQAEFAQSKALAGLGQALTPVQKFAEAEKKPKLSKINPKAPWLSRIMRQRHNEKMLKNSLSNY